MDGDGDFFKTHKERVLSKPLTKTLNTLWYDMGYRYETMLNRAVSLFAEQYKLRDRKSVV